MQKLKEYRKLAVIALLASVLTAVPLAIRANAQSNDQTNPVVDMINNGVPDNDVQPASEEPDQTPPEEQAPPSAEEQTPPPVEENEVPVDEPEPTPVTILEAITIAQSAHDEVAGETSDVIKAQVKLKKLNDEKVYKVVFADGWRIYVRAANGEVVLMKDESNKEHKCGNRGRSAVAAWQNAFRKKWGFNPTRSYDAKPKHHNLGNGHHYGWWNGHGWNKPDQQPEQSNDEQDQEPAETEGAVVIHNN